VVRGLHSKDSVLVNTGNPADLIAEVSCNGSGGQLAKNEYGQCVVPAIALNAWICSQPKEKLQSINVFRDDNDCRDDIVSI
jgi:hypothetical protein